MSETETQAAAILDRMYARGMNAKEFAAELAAAEERGRRRGYGECRDDAAAVVDAAFQAGKWEGLYSKIQSLAPRDSGKEG